MKFIHYILFIIACVAGTTAVSAQGLPFFRNYLPEEYNAHNRNFDILAEPEEGVVYVANFEGLLIYDQATWDIKHTPGITRVTALYKDSDGNIWSGGYNYMGYLELNEVKDLTFHPLEEIANIRSEVNRIWEANGVLFFSTVDNVVYRVDENDKWTKVVDGAVSIPQEKQDGLQSYSIDHTQRLQLEDNFYAVAAEGKGINFTDGKGNVLFSFTEENGLINNNINRMSYDGNGMLWGATDNGVFSIMVPSSYTRYTATEGLRGEVLSMYVLNNQLYVGTMAGLFKQEGTRFVQIPGFDLACWQLNRRGDALLAATSNGVYRINGNKVEHLTTSSTTSIMLGNDGFYSGEIDGVYFNTRSEHTKVLSMESVMDMKVDQEGTLWLRNLYGEVGKTTFNGKLFANTEYARNEELATFIYQDGNVTVVTVDDEEPFAYPGFSFADDNGVLWLTDKESKNLYAYKDGRRMDEYDEILSPLKDYTVRSMVLKDGLLWIGGNYGLVVLDITHPDPLLTADNELDICTVRISNDSLVWAGFDKAPETLRNLPSTERHLTITYALHSESLVGQTLYRYKLNNNSWTTWSENQTIEFVNLSYGSYNLVVQALDAKGKLWEAEPLHFRIKSPIYLTWYMGVVYVFLLVVLMMAVARWRTRRLEREKLKLEGIVQERTAEVVKQRDEIVKQKDEIEEKSASLQKALNDLEAAQKQLIRQEKMATAGKLTQGLIDRILNPMNYINNFSKLSSGLIKDLKANIEDEEDHMDQENFEDTMDVLEMLSQNLEKVEQHGLSTTRTLKAMEEILKDRSGGMQEMNLVELLNLNFEMMNKYYEKDIKECHIVTKLDCPYDSLHMMGNSEQLSKSIMSFLGNSIYSLVKKSQRVQFQPEAVLKVERLEDKVKLTVHDNGVGIEQTIIDKIFDPFFTTKTTGEASGVGLYLSHEIIQNHGGNIRVESVKDEFAEFVIEIPLLKQ